MNYTLAQVRGFLAAVAREERQRDAQFLSLAALAQRGDGRALDRAFDRLTERA